MATIDKKELKRLQKEQEEREKQLKIQQELRERYDKRVREFSLRKALLRDTSKFYENMQKTIGKLQDRQTEQEQWNNYLECPNRPSPKNPPQLREYLMKWNKQLTDCIQEYFDWLFNINGANVRVVVKEEKEQSDTSFEEPPAAAVIIDDDETIQLPNLEDPIKEKNDEILIILQQMEEVLDKPESFYIDEQTKEDLITIKFDYRMSLENCWENLSYYLLKDIENYMTLPNDTTATYGYNSETFSMNMFTFRDVELPSDHFLEKDIDFPEMYAVVKCPKTISFQGYAIRGIWTNYDHLSDTAPSFILSNKPEPIKDLSDVIASEWDAADVIMQKKLNQMRRARAAYEEIIIKELENFKLNGKPTEKQKKTKLVEPPVVTLDTIVDVSAELNKQLEIEYQKYILQFHPDVLNLEYNEVNLRKFQIYGGLYHVNYINLPKQNKLFTDNQRYLIVHYPEKLKYAPYQRQWAPLEFPDDSKMKPDEKARLLERNKILFYDLIEVTIALPRKVVWWETPIVCRWESWEDSQEFQNLPPEVQHFNLHYDEITKQKDSLLFTNPLPDKNKFIDVDDIDLTQPPEGVKLHYYIVNHILPRMTTTYQFECEVQDEKDQLEAEIKRRELLRKEKEEDRLLKLRLTYKQKLFREKERKGRKTAKMEDLSKSEREETEIKTSKSESETDEENTQSELDGESDMPLKTCISSTVAKDLFLYLKNINPLPVRKEATDYLLKQLESSAAEHFLLSQLLEQIENYNKTETPHFITYKELKKKIPIKGNKQKDTKSNQPKPKPKPKRKNEDKDTTADEVNEQKEQKIELSLIPHDKGKWITNGIFITKHDTKKETLTFRTLKIGVFGLVGNKYYNFPIKKWELTTFNDKPSTTELLIEGTQLSLSIFITAEGYHFEINSPKKCPIKPPKTVLSLKKLKEFLQTSGINIFAEIDGMWYMENISYKDSSMTDHVYKCIGHFGMTHEFKSSAWNYKVGRREAILSVREILEDQRTLFKEIKITAFDSYFVEINKGATDFEIRYRLNPPDQEFNCDIYQLLNSFTNEKNKVKLMNTNVKLKWNISQLFQAINPLSFTS